MEEYINNLSVHDLYREISDRLVINILEIEAIIVIMNTRGYWCEIKSPFEPEGLWFVGFTPHGCTGWNGRPDNQMSDKKGHIAVMKSALLTLLNKERQ